jgi:hypothetical protein
MKTSSIFITYGKSLHFKAQQKLYYKHTWQQTKLVFTTQLMKFVL